MTWAVAVKNVVELLLEEEVWHSHVVRKDSLELVDTCVVLILVEAWISIVQVSELEGCLEILRSADT